jgi:hypothetical protein
MITLAKQLPSLYQVPLELTYGAEILNFSRNYYRSEMPTDAPLRNKTMAKNAANQRVKQCKLV